MEERNVGWSGTNTTLNAKTAGYLRHFEREL